ncbi:hypothetical protein A9X02_22465 [Mycobacterium malmoense]|nr:hypothetical protein A9X02_22465 [Mycobacterium malmoense]
MSAGRTWQQPPPMRAPAATHRAASGAESVRGRDRRAGAEIGGVDGDDLVGVVRQEPGRPQRVGQVVTARLELGGQTAIVDQDRLADRSQFHPATVG